MEIKAMRKGHISEDTNEREEIDFFSKVEYICPNVDIYNLHTNFWMDFLCNQWEGKSSSKMQFTLL